MKKNIVKKAFKEGLLLGVRTHLLEWGESIIGFIANVEEPFFEINEIDEYGFFIGKTKIQFDSVINIDIEDRYQKRLLFIHENNANFDINKRVTVWVDGKEIINQIKSVKEQNKIATLFLNEEDFVIGFILEYDKEYVMIKNIGVEGDEDGFSCYPISKIEGIRIDGLEEQKIQLLFDNRKLFY